MPAFGGHSHIQPFLSSIPLIGLPSSPKDSRGVISPLLQVNPPVAVVGVDPKGTRGRLLKSLHELPDSDLQLILGSKEIRLGRGRSNGQQFPRTKEEEKKEEKKKKKEEKEVTRRWDFKGL